MRYDNQRDPKLVYRLAPCPYYDIEGTESWLGSMAEKGFVLSKNGFFSGFAIFEKREPCTFLYRLEVVCKITSMWDDNSGEPSDEAVELRESCGWKYLTTRKQFNIFYSENTEVRELNIDTEAQAIVLIKIRKKMRNSFISSILFLIIYPLIISYGSVFLCAIEIGTWLLLWGTLLIMWALCDSIVRLIQLRKLQRKMHKGQSLEHRKNWKISALAYYLRKIVCTISIFAYVGCLIHVWSLDMDDTKVQQLTDYSDTIPFATMENFAPGGEFVRVDNRFDNTIEVKSDWLAPTYIHLFESANFQSRDGRFIDGGIIVDYYKTISPWVANELAHEMWRQDKLSKFKYYESFTLPELNVDYAIGYSTFSPTVILQKGNTVIRVTFIQNSNNNMMPVEEWVRIFADSI
ncbi:DUF2812 domain-containing protein [[Clostridium] fimetarium]|uniref:DUF2812 domain-containing protein n=1 Tax=[Clostridium] fimetarium TaxID=99656 RepID=A0A1I0R0V7_9FIRM|nr:DUF2812 domain-containing protein [[Clostridium] fimetarium]SEW33713.1 Protein of unknown function [[Clostridium] fimetarium]